MPDVRLAATGMDSCPASDEDTEDELESARRTSNNSRTLLPSTSRQLVGESHRPSFRPGLEGGSSDDEVSSGRGGPSLSGIEHRRSAEGQVINPPVTGGVSSLKELPLLVLLFLEGLTVTDCSVSVLLQAMEEAGMAAVAVRRVETMAGFPPSLSLPLTSRPPTTSCVGWASWAAALQA